MSQASLQTSSNTNYHPTTARCPEAIGKYYAWNFVSKSFKKGSKQYETACLRYKWHLAKCAVCREGLDAVR